MACLKAMGTCLYPHCLVQKADVHQMGTVNDLKRRVTNAHQDDHPTHWRIEEVRKKIFLKGRAINSAHVEAFLKDESLIPTRVRIFIVTLLFWLIGFSERIL